MMGAVFEMRHANLMAYITSRSGLAPRASEEDLTGFLAALIDHPTEHLIPEVGFESWPEEISNAARRALDAFHERRRPESGRATPPSVVEAVLDELRSEFSRYILYALAVGGGEDLRERAHGLARLPMYGGLLVLIPVFDSRDRNFEVLDPIPAFSRALHAAPNWPGFLFWTTNGASAFIPLTTLESFKRELEEARDDSHHHPRWPFRHGSPAAYDELLRRWAVRLRARRILHLSDLHFGTEHALHNQAILDAQLRNVIGSVDRVVITGDLFDSPRADYATLFANFRNNITHLAGGKEPISIPGNHDQRRLGNVGRDFEQIAAIGSTRLVVDDDCRVIFTCFNSSERGSFARGKIPSTQFRRLGGEYRTLTSARAELARYLPIALVHHHPFSFDVEPETWLQRVLAAFGLREESFLEMVNASDLHQWCADWRITTILHGHKHKARYVEREVTGSDGSRARLTAIGCGSSLGAEGSPVSYNLLEWDADSQRWVASVFQSVNGGAFHEVMAAVSPVRRVAGATPDQ